MTAIPSTYKDATKLSANARAALAAARLVWDGLPKGPRAALSEAVRYAHGRFLDTGRRRDIQRLHDEGIAIGARVTPLGELVREAGTRTKIEVSGG